MIVAVLGNLLLPGLRVVRFWLRVACFVCDTV